MCNSRRQPTVVENRLQNFVTCFLLLHNAPISLFSLRTAYLETSPRVHQWLLFLSRRKDVNEIVLELGANDWYKLPTSLFFCKELRRLELVRFQLKTPPEFRGFLRLKELKLQQIISPNFDVESLIFSCPVLESLEFSYFSNLLDVYMPSPGDADFESLKAKLPSHGVFTHLKNVEMTDILAVPRELNFIKYLLKYTPALKVMSVKMSHYVPERRTELAEEIVNYLCISTHMVLTVDWFLNMRHAFWTFTFPISPYDSRLDWKIWVKVVKNGRKIPKFGTVCETIDLNLFLRKSI